VQPLGSVRPTRSALRRSLQHRHSHPSTTLALVAVIDRRKIAAKSEPVLTTLTTSQPCEAISLSWVTSESTSHVEERTDEYTYILGNLVLLKAPATQTEHEHCQITTCTRAEGHWLTLCVTVRAKTPPAKTPRVVYRPRKRCNR
jgi:hypothetical protein